MKGYYTIRTAEERRALESTSVVFFLDVSVGPLPASSIADVDEAGLPERLNSSLSWLRTVMYLALCANFPTPARLTFVEK